MAGNCERAGVAGGRTARAALVACALAVSMAAQVPLWAAPQRVPDRNVLIRELQLPKISLNLNVTFSTSELRIPPSATPEEDIARLSEELQQEGRADLHLRLARLCASVGRYEEAGMHYRVAAAGYEDLVRREPRNARAYQEFAETLIALGEDHEAAELIEQSLVLDGTLWRTHELAADLHAKQAVLAYSHGVPALMRSHFAAAEEAAGEAVRLGPDKPQPLVTLFIAKWLPAVLELRADPRAGLRQMGRFEEMSQILKRAAALAPAFPRLQRYAIACKLTPFFTAQMVKGLDKGLWEELDEQQRRVLTSCREEFLTLATAAPELRVDSLVFAAVACFMMDDRKGLYDHLRAAADADPTRSEALELSIGFLAYEGKWQQAQRIAEEIIARTPSAKAHTWMGRIHAEQGKWKQAEESFRAALRHDDTAGLANLGLGVVLLKGGASPLEALGPLRAAWEQGRREPEILLAWGVALALIGEVEEGRGHIRQVLAIWPPSPGLERLAREFGIDPKAPAP